VGGLLGGGTTASPALPPAAALLRPGLARVVVLVDADPRGRAVAAQLPGSRVVDVRTAARPLPADVVYVATSWEHALGALAAGEAVAPLGGVVVLPWLVAPSLVDAARGGSVLLLTGAPLEDPLALAYRQALRVLPGERPSVAGLVAWRRSVPSPTVSTYAAGGAGVFPAGLDPHGAHTSGLPAWAAAGALTPVRRQAVPPVLRETS
ncbi:MAG: hypothetical protein JWM64_2447, partial [Frankiales bacterium]|nr:hypothetical protein [Frankiales bacterium]